MNAQLGDQWRLAYAEKVRAAMGPELRAVADALRETFGVKLEWLETERLQLGTPLPPSEPIGEKSWDGHRVA